jgi:hypothetical protein
MKLKTLITLIGICGITGCTLLNRNSGPKTGITAPSDIKDMAERAMREAKACIDSVRGGHELIEIHRVIIKKEVGEAYDKGAKFWVFTMPTGKGAGGYTEFDGKVDAYIIHVGSNPKTGGEVSYDALKHEFGHYWLMSNEARNSRHENKYSSCFIYWNSGYDKVH